MSNRTDIVVETDNAEGQVLLSASRVYDLTEDKTQDTINGEIKNTLLSLIQESAFEIVEENGEYKLYWYGAQSDCPYTIVYENGVYNLYFNYTVS